MSDITEDWAALNHPPEEIRKWAEARDHGDNGCVVCGVGGDVLIGDYPQPVTWRCHVCRGLVCRNCTLTIPGSSPAEYYELTLCSRICWERAGRPEE